MSCFCYLSSSTSRAEEWTWGLTVGLQSLPACSRRVVTHCRFPCSHAPCSAVPGTHLTAPRSRGCLCPSLPARPNSASACHPEAEWKHPFSPLGLCATKSGPSCWGLRTALFRQGQWFPSPKSCCVLLQTEKADRRQNFVSLALRKRYSYLTEPGMSELLLPKY